MMPSKVMDSRHYYMRQLIIIITATHAVLVSQAAFINYYYLQQGHCFNKGRCDKRLLDSLITLKVSKENPNDQAAGAHHTDPMELLPQLHTYQKPRQKRRPQTTLTRPRKPRFYWHDEENMRLELKSFWEDDLNVTISEYYPNELPPIPSEFLLNYFNRNDLRWGIAQIGGRETLSHVLGGAFIIPGKWKEAKKLGIIQRVMHLIDDDTNMSSTKKSKVTTKSNSEINTINREPLISMIQHTEATKLSKAFWSKEKAIRELYCYLDNYKKYKHRPSVFMPQLSELKHEGYQKLFNACSRFKKLPQEDAFGHSIQYSAGLVPYKEWRFFESQLQLFVELQHYLNLHHEGKEDTFPDPDLVKKRGHVQLSHLIRTHGGKLLLAQKLDMELAASTMSIQSWGPFSLDFAIQLLQFIREQYMTINPPLTFPIISMPSEQDLIRFGYDDLTHQISRFGGYENVARRLGLAYFDGKNEKVDERLVRRAKRLWTQRKR